MHPSTSVSEFPRWEGKILNVADVSEESVMIDFDSFWLAVTVLLTVIAWDN